jgi:LemA protein
MGKQELNNNIKAEFPQFQCNFKPFPRYATVSSGEGEAYVFFFMLMGLASYLWGIGQYRLKKFIEYTPTSKAVSVAPGISEVAGSARFGTQKFLSPFDRKECAYYNTRVYKWQGSGKHRRRHLVSTLDSKEPFYIEDETGKVMVRASLEDGTDGGLFSNQIFSLLSQKKSFSNELVDKDVNYRGRLGGGIFSFFGNSSEKLTPFLSQYVPSLVGYNDEIEVHERYIMDGDPLYMIGRAEECEINGKTDIVVGRDEKNGVFCIADGNEKRAVSSIALWAYISLILGPAIFIGLLQYFFLRFNIDAESALQISAALAFVMYAYVFAIFLTEFYNAMIILRNNVGRAQANVGVLLKRRTDLIQNLATVVSAAASHEKSVMAQIASVRAGSLMHQKLLAIAENYPGLKTSENFLALSQELSHTENWLSGARTYVSDSIMLYNTRVASFPYMLFAPALGLKPIDFSASVEN